MKNRPKIKLKLNTTDKLIEIVGWIAVLGIWVLTIVNYFELPEIIPTHYNGTGKADGFGSRSTILVLPIISTILFIGLTVLNQYPHILNYATEITKENAVQQYTNATRLLRFLKLIVVIVFSLIVLRTIQNTKGTADGLGEWFLPLTLGIIFIPICYFLVKANQKK